MGRTGLTALDEERALDLVDDLRDLRELLGVSAVDHVIVEGLDGHHLGYEPVVFIEEQNQVHPIHHGIGMIAGNRHLDVSYAVLLLRMHNDIMIIYRDTI